MEGLNKILLKIEEENDIEVKKILDAGKTEAERYKESVVKEAEADADVIVKSAEKKAKQMIVNAKSGCEAYIKRQELDAKAKVIASFIDDAIKEIKSMDGKEYFEHLEKLILKYYHKDNGFLLMSEKDINNMPDKFVENINSKLENASLTLSKGTGIDKGFILKYGGIEENCTFDALIEEKRDLIKDKLTEQINA